jgi:hypothetical protein
VRRLLPLFCFILPLFALSGDELFRERIEPVLSRDCQGCHGSVQALSKLAVSSRAALLQGGARGPALLPGQPDQSLLLHVLEGRNGLQMPPGGPQQKLPPETIAAFRAWIAAGAPWPARAAEAKWIYKEEDLWAFRPVRPFDPGKTIDSFLPSPAPRADRRTLIRRVTFDLTGLPPTPEEVNTFLADKSPQAWNKLIDRLLASPHYGERYGRHWLDVVRYADTSGYSNDFERPNAWRYRDYVIRSLNQDKPYDQFIREQVAGDELYPGNPEARIATGFLRAGPWEHTAMSVEAVTRQLFLDDVAHHTVSTFLGLTLGCAKCHDHKFDPIPTKDYYRVQAVFASTEFARPKLPFLPTENTTGLAAGAAHLQALYDRTLARMKEFRQNHPDSEEHEEFKLYRKHAQLYQDSLHRFAPLAFAVSSGPLDGQTDGGPTLKYPPLAGYRPAPVHILPGGNIQSPAEAVTPGVLSVLERVGGYPAAGIPDRVAGRRSAFAQWIADPRNPLTARVIVNRLWQAHFGEGIAGDPSNFGKMGKKPTNPALLDWLAGALVHHGWRLKAIHRLILQSAAYQSTNFTPRRLEAEALRDSLLAVSGELNREAGGPGVFPQINEDVARQPQHRMGSLAPPYTPSPLRRQRNRRTIYTFQQRSLPDPLVEVFNGPTLDLACERREASTVPTQAFGLLNSQFANDLALAMAARLEKEAPTLRTRLERAFALAFSRPPQPAELTAATRHFRRMLAYHQTNPPPAKPQPRPLVHKITSELTGQTSEFLQAPDPAPYEANLHPSAVGPATRALSDVTLMLLNANEFVYVY